MDAGFEPLRPTSAECGRKKKKILRLFVDKKKTNGRTSAMQVCRPVTFAEFLIGRPQTLRRVPAGGAKFEFCFFFFFPFK